LKPGLKLKEAELVVARAMSISSSPAELQQIQSALKQKLPEIDQDALFDKVNELLDSGISLEGHSGGKIFLYITLLST
jgi:hypothetical protein